MEKSGGEAFTADMAGLERPEVRAVIFHPRRDTVPGPPPGGMQVAIPVAGPVSLGARFHPGADRGPCVLFFHGNGEIASDYDDLAPFFLRAGAALLVVDYRGYGRSGGIPGIASLLADSHAVLEYAARRMGGEGHGGPWIVMGRSLGSAAALEIAAARPDLVKGLIIESGFAHGAALAQRLGLDVRRLGIAPELEGAFDHLAKIGRCRQPTLILHGEQDHIIPLADARELYDASPADEKRLLVIPAADHNSLLTHGLEAYFEALGRLVERVAAGETGRRS